MIRWNFGFALTWAISVWVASSAWASAAKIQKWIVDMDQGSGITEFHAKGRPSALKFIGKGSAPKGRLVLEGARLSGFAQFSLDTLDTGITLRNEHMKKKYLETEKFPEAKLTLSELELPGISEGDFSLQGIPFRGKLLLHGIEKEVSGVSAIVRKGMLLSIDAKFGLKVGDFAIASPSFAGVTMANEVEIAVSSRAPLSR